MTKNKVKGRTAGIVMLLLLLTVSLRGALAADWQTMKAEPEGAYVLVGRIDVESPPDANIALRICGDSSKDPQTCYKIAVEKRKAYLTKIDGDSSRPLCSPQAIPETPNGSPVEMALYRGPWRIALIWNTTVLIRAYDAEFNGPHIAYKTAEGTTVDDAWVQGLTEPTFDDVFMRTAKEDKQQKIWDHVSGDWQLISLREDRQAERMSPSRSSNSFSYHCPAGDAAALTTAGRWFWRNCSYSLALRARGMTGSAGVAFYVQDADNYLLLQWDNRFTDRPNGTQLRLSAVIDGDRKTLAKKPSGYLPNQWYRLRADVCDGAVRCYIDDELQLQAQTSLFGNGKIGMFAKGTNGAWFDDVRVRGADFFEDDFSRDTEHVWRTRTGQWQISGKAARPAADEKCILVTGNPRWSDYAFSADVSDNNGACGLVVCSRPQQGSYIFRWAADNAEVAYSKKAQIVKTAADGTEVLAERQIPTGLAETVTATVITEGHYIAGFLGGQRVVDAVLRNEELPRGRVGLYADAKNAAVFDNVSVYPLVERKVARITKEFTDTEEHFEMAEWASTRHNWVKPPEDADEKIWWTKGAYYGPLQIAFTLQNLKKIDGTVRVRLRAEKSPKVMGNYLHISSKKGGRKLTLSLTRNEKSLADGELTPKNDTADIRIDLNGSYITATVNDRHVITANVVR